MPNVYLISVDYFVNDITTYLLIYIQNVLKMYWFANNSIFFCVKKRQSLYKVKLSEESW